MGTVLAQVHPLSARLAALLLALLVASPAAATTKVIVFNHTSKALKLTTTSDLGTGHWEAGVEQIAPWSQGLLYETNRDEGVVDGETYVFETRVDAVAWRPAVSPLLLRVRLEGGLVGSSLAHGLRDASGEEHPWSSDRTERRVPFELFGTTALELSVQAVFAGTEDDIHVILREPAAPPRGTWVGAPAAWRYTHLDVLSYNVYMRPRDKPPYAMLNGQDIRATLLPPHLVGYDVLVLQELFEESSRALLLSGLVEQGYAHATAAVGDDVFTVRWTDEGVQFPKNWNGGVVIASRWPIVEGRSAQVLFRSVCSGVDCGADKGAVYVAIDKAAPGSPPVPFHVVGTHLNNGDWSVQRKQLEMVRALIDAVEIPPEEPLVIAGDFNIDRIAHPERYREMLEILAARDPCPHLSACGHPFTADEPGNDLSDGESQTRVDYVLYSTRHLGSTSGTFARTRVPRAAEPWREFPHEPWMWDLSDHYPVYGSFLFMTRPSP